MIILHSANRALARELIARRDGLTIELAPDEPRFPTRIEIEEPRHIRLSQAEIRELSMDYRLKDKEV